MTSLLIAVVCSLFFASCDHLVPSERTAPRKTPREVNGLSGPVRSVFIATAAPVNKSGRLEPEQQQPVSFDVYDARGNRTEHISYTSAGSIGEIIVFTYDVDGNEIEAIEYSADGTPESRTVSTYSTTGQRVAALSYSADGLLKRRTVFTYDQRGNKSAAVSYTADGALESKTVFTYNAEGNLKEAAWYDVNDILGGNSVYTYNARGHLTASTYYVYNPDGTLRSRTDSIYGSRQNPTEVIWYGANGTITKKETSTYAWDALGNWTKRITVRWVTTMDGNSYFEPPLVTYRTLTYYTKEH